MQNSNIKIHFGYCVAILLGLIVLISTDRWSSKQDFTVYLSNAATITSLLLAVVAIFYSFVSNDSLSRSLGSISTVSKDVGDAKSEIRSFVESNKLAHEGIAAVSDAMIGSSRDLHASLSTLGETLEEISRHNAALRQVLSEIPSKIDKLESTVSDATKQMTTPKHDPKPPRSRAQAPISNEAIDTFMRGSPIGGNLLSYAAVLAHKNNKQLVLGDVSAAMGKPKLASYFNGFLTCMHGVDIIDYTFIEGSTRTYKINRVNAHLASNIRSYFLDYIESLDDEQETLEWKNRLDRLDDLLGQATEA